MNPKIMNPTHPFPCARRDLKPGYISLMAVFGLSGVLVLAFALTTVSYLTWKAARANPVKALRYE